MSDSAPLKRLAIIGTAPSWRQCPFDDLSLEIASLNDAYSLGIPRASLWFDMHPLHQMVMRPRDKPMTPADAPVGGYLRPDGHLQWLASQKIPVFLNQARPDWPHSVTFPRAELEAQFADIWPWRRTAQGVVEKGPNYQASTPAWMLLWAIANGYTEIHIYGIHLATEWEYLKQRPNLEFLIGYARGRGIQIVLPADVPICQGAHAYAYDLKPDLDQEVIRRGMTALKLELARLTKQQARPWYQQVGSSHASRIAKLQLELADHKQAFERAQTLQHYAG